MNQRAGSEREGRRSWPGPYSRRSNLTSLPEWTLRNSSKQGRAAHHLPHPLWAKDIKGWRKGLPAQAPGVALSLPRTHWARRVDKADALPLASTLLSQPAPQTYTDSAGERQADRKELCLKPEKREKAGKATQCFS